VGGHLRPGLIHGVRDVAVLWQPDFLGESGIGEDAIFFLFLGYWIR